MFVVIVTAASSELDSVGVTYLHLKLVMCTPDGTLQNVYMGMIKQLLPLCIIVLLNVYVYITTDSHSLYLQSCLWHSSTTSYTS